MKIKPETLGYVDLTGKTIVSDPCYGRDVWCMKRDLSVKPGQYKVNVVYSDEGDWGMRVAGIVLVHRDYEGVSLTRWVNDPADIGVDSGQCGIFDDSIYPISKDGPEREAFYDECCKITLSNKQAGILLSGHGIVTSSGYGDGSYILKTISRKGENIALMVDFDLVRMNQMMKKLVGLA